MNHNQLVYLVEAVHRNSIRKAARALGMTQPSLSTAIMALEKEVGMQLLVRSNQGVSLTPDGQRFLALAQDIVDKTAALRELFRGGEEDRAVSSLTVATNPSQITLRALRELDLCNGSEDTRVTVRNCSVEGCAQSVHSLESELGVVFITSGCYKNYMATFREHQLEYHPLSVNRCCVNLGPKTPSTAAGASPARSSCPTPLPGLWRTASPSWISAPPPTG